MDINLVAHASADRTIQATHSETGPRVAREGILGSKDKGSEPQPNSRFDRGGKLSQRKLEAFTTQTKNCQSTR